MAGRNDQNLFIPLGMGLETSVDDKLLPAGKNPSVVNGIWLKSGELVKRNGNTALGGQYAAQSVGNMPLPWQLATHKGALVTLSQAGPRPIGVYSPTLTKWIAPAGSSAVDASNGVASKLRGQVLPRRDTVFRSNADGAELIAEVGSSVANNGIYTLVAWVETKSGANATYRGQILEQGTGKTLTTFSLGASSINGVVKAVYVNNEFRLVYIDNANIKYVSWTSSNLGAGNLGFNGPTTLATDATAFYMDVIAKGTDMLVLYDGATTRIVKRDSGGVNTASNLTAQGGGAVAIGHHYWVSDLGVSGKVAAVVSSATDGVRVHFDINTATGTTALSYTIDGAAGQQEQIVAFTITANATGEFVVLYHVSTSPSQITWGRRVLAGITTGAWIMRAALASKPFVNNGQFYVNIVYESNDQGSYFTIRVPTVAPSPVTDLVDGNRTPSARFCTDSAAAAAFCPMPPEVITLSTDQFLSTAIVRVRLVSQAGITPGTFDTGVDMITMTFNPATVGTPVGTPREFADNLYVCGGILAAFDGQTFAEEGFHVYPEFGGLSQGGGGALTLLGNYTYIAVYRYTDDFGRLRRSFPSSPISFTLTGGNQTITAPVRTLKLHGRPGKVVIELYRNIPGQAAQFKLIGTKANDETADTVSFTDTQSDVAWASGEDLYTNGGVLPSDPPPPALAIALYKDRIAVISAEDPTLIWVSLPLVEGQGPRFSDESTVRVDDAYGDLTALAAIDDRLVIFKRDAIYTLVGDGPDQTGAGIFGMPTLVATGIGCSEPRSVVQTPEGVMFRSMSTRSGIYLLNRGLALDYVGAPVQSFLTNLVPANAATIADAVHIPQLQRTEFFTNGATLVYDNVQKLWSSYTLSATCATQWGGAHVFQRVGQASLVLWAENTSGSGGFDDNGNAVSMTVDTPWLSLAALKGFQRFYRVQGVGETRIYSDPGDPGHRLTVTLFQNFNTNTVATKIRDMQSNENWNDWELRYSSKATSYKFRIQIDQIPLDSVSFAGPKISGISLVYITKQGVRKPTPGMRLA